MVVIMLLLVPMIMSRGAAVLLAGDGHHQLRVGVGVVHLVSKFRVS